VVCVSGSLSHCAVMLGVTLRLRYNSGGSHDGVVGWRLHLLRNYLSLLGNRFPALRCALMFRGLGVQEDLSGA
jgi:hypothetical protein